MATVAHLVTRMYSLEEPAMTKMRMTTLCERLETPADASTLVVLLETNIEGHRGPRW